MSPEPAQPFIQAVRAFADPARAERDRQYHKSARPHWGINMPQLDSVVKRHVKQHSAAELFQLAQTLWNSGTFDLMIAAGRILGRREIPASPRLWRTLDTWLDDVDGWALEDVLASAAWKCLLHDPAVLDDLERWTTHPGVWRRRAAARLHPAVCQAWPRPGARPDLGRRLRPGPGMVHPRRPSAGGCGS